MSKSRAITQTFLSNGVWTSPPNFQGPVLLMGCGGGQGGRGSHDIAGASGASAPVIAMFFNVDPLTAYTVTIGTGTIGDASAPGEPGEDTLFGNVIFPGGGSSSTSDPFALVVRGNSYSPPSNTPTDAPNGTGGGGGGGSNLEETDGGKGGSGRLTITWWV